MATEELLTLEDVQQAVVNKRQIEGQSLRQVARQIGIPTPTLNRFEHGSGCTGEHLLCLMQWLWGSLGELRTNDKSGYRRLED